MLLLLRIQDRVDHRPTELRGRNDRIEFLKDRKQGAHHHIDGLVPAGTRTNAPLRQDRAGPEGVGIPEAHF